MVHNYYTPLDCPVSDPSATVVAKLRTDESGICVSEEPYFDIDPTQPNKFEQKSSHP